LKMEAFKVINPVVNGMESNETDRMMERLNERDDATIKWEATGEEFETTEEFAERVDEVQKEETFELVDKYLQHVYNHSLDDLTEGCGLDNEELAEKAIASVELDIRIIPEDAQVLASEMKSKAAKKLRHMDIELDEE
jgi:hypothetical protein